MTEMRKKVNSNYIELNPDVRKLVIERNFVKAEKLARKNLKKFSTPIDYYTLALCLATRGFLQNINSKKQEAKKYYKEIIIKFPKTMHAYLAKARICEESYKLKNAIPFYKQALKKYPTSLNAIHIGNAYKQLKRIKLAEKYYFVAEKLEKGSAKNNIKSISIKKAE